MTKSEYKTYLQSAAWQAKRQEALEWHGNACAKCDIPRWLAEIAYDQDLNVHHLTYENRGDEEMEDLEVLCRRCHEIETFKRSELREVKDATCEACGDRHWDYRSDHCIVCQQMRCDFYGFFQRFYYPNPNRNGEKFWIAALENLAITFLGEGASIAQVGEMLGGLAKVQAKDYAKRLNEETNF